ncbi:HvfC/BufC family peptide modification chaperone [Aquabacterium sp.]|uniref:HvfC/BufC family peptide modification chaperone n=1 Tax=Aquabacterium sp. TaxID=1872578 RepID=UPI003D6CFD8E
MSMDEAQRQAAVLQAIWEGPNGAGPQNTEAGWHEHGDALVKGLAAYQGNATATAERALAAAYPTVQALLGEEALAGLARLLWRQHPPRHGDLTAWGDALPDCLARLPEVQDWPYLPDCARLDWARHTAEHAADALFDPESLSLLGTHDPNELAIELRPSLSVLRSDWPLVTLWEAHQPATNPTSLAALREAVAAQRAETAVVWRRHWRAEVVALPQASMASWMISLASGPSRPLSSLLDQALTDFDLGAWLELALRQGWIWRVTQISGRAD